MKIHIKKFLDFWNYDICDINEINCWICNSNQAVQIMHIDPKGIGGRNSAEYEENYCPGCSECHKAGEGNNEKKKEYWDILIPKIKAYKPNHKWSDKFKQTWYYKNFVDDTRAV